MGSAGGVTGCATASPQGWESLGAALWGQPWDTPLSAGIGSWRWSAAGSEIIRTCETGKTLLNLGGTRRKHVKSSNK